MFCPKCSQEQVSDETRFCSQCGFHLNIVKTLLAEENTPQSAEMQKQKRSFGKRDLTIGAALMFVFAFIVAALTVAFPPSSSFRIIYLTIAWLALTLLINIKPIIQYFVRGDNSASGDNILSSKIMSRFSSQNENQNAALPAAQSIPADFTMPGLNTAEMVSPPSVTEQTTNLLEKK